MADHPTPATPGPDQPAPEYLESGTGTPLAGRAPSRRPWLLAGAGVAGVALLGGVAWGAWWWFADGAQAAEALPGTAVGYVGLTLDPSGSQKVEALTTLRKLPAVAEELELDGAVEDIDLKETLATAFLATAPCEGLTYAEHLEPWLGDRLGLAAVPVEEVPQPVLALEVTDADAAQDGLDALTACGAEDGEAGDGVYEVRDGWVLVAPEQAVLDAALDGVESGTLAEDEDFQRWTDEAGEPGVLTMYAAPEAADYLGDALEDAFGGLGGPVLPDPAVGTAVGAASEGSSPEEQLQEAIDGFEGAAAQVRFVDGAMELEVAGGLAGSEVLDGAGGAGDLVSSLPSGTVLVAATGISQDALAEAQEELAEGAEDLVGDVLGPVDLDLPALLGDAVALVVGPDLDIDGLSAGTTTDVPVALLSTGELAAAEQAAAEVGDLLGAFLGVVPEVAGEDGRVVVGLDEAWVDELAEEGGGLGEDERFGAALPEADGADSLLFLDADALVELVGEAVPDSEDDEVVANLEPLQALGLSSTFDDDTLRLVLRVTTD